IVDTDISTTNNAADGAHCEGAIQEALWIVFKDVPLKDGFWKAFNAKPAPNTIFDLLERWKASGATGKDKLVAALKSRGMEFGYKSRGDTDATQRWKCTDAFDEAKKEFSNLDDLIKKFGAAAGEPASGASARETQYLEEFYNRNKLKNDGAM